MPNPNLLDQEQRLLTRLTGDDAFQAADRFFFAELTPINGSNARGAAVFAYDADTNQLSVLLGASGLEAGMTHVQHIHGFADNRESVEATLAFDTDNDGFIESAEGVAAYGPVMFPLPTTTAPDGTQFIVQTFQLPADSPVAGPFLDLREYNIHGVTLPPGAGAGTGGEANGGPGGYTPALVAAGGEIEEVDSLGQLTSALARSGVFQLAHDHGWALA
jgi:hypothetical protein